jgi:hypothetical protein
MSDEDAEMSSRLFQYALQDFRDSSLFPKSSPWLIRPTVLERERRRIQEIASNSAAATLVRRLELAALAVAISGTQDKRTEIDPEDRAYLLAAADELLKSSVFVFDRLDPPSGTDRTARVVDAVRDAKKVFGDRELSTASGVAGDAFSQLSGYLKDLGPRLPRRSKDTPVEQLHPVTRGVFARGLRDPFGNGRPHADS